MLMVFFMRIHIVAMYMIRRRPFYRKASDTVCETYKDFAENTSIHGLKYTVQKEIGITERLFWLVIIIGGFCGAAYMTILFWKRYLSNPTRTTILTSFAPIGTMPFPAITICNINRILDFKVDLLLTKLNSTKGNDAFIKNVIPQILALTNPNAVNYNITELSFLEAFLKEHKISVSELMRELGQNCNEMFSYCFWNRQEMNCTEIFRETLSADGYCCTFNTVNSSGYKSLHSGYNGIGSGLFLILNAMLQPVQHSFLRGSGFKVIIHDPDEFPGVQSTTRIISVNRFSLVQLFGTKMTCTDDVSHLPISQRHCFFSNESPEVDSSNMFYSAVNCLTECEANLYFKQCGCIPYFFQFQERPSCALNQIGCLRAVRKSLNLTRMCDCMPQCEDDYYTVITSTIMLDRNLKNFSMMDFDNDILKDNPVILNVFFLKQIHTVYSRDTITSTIYLLSSFGGVFSLFLGCSLITVFEMIYFGIFRFIINFKILGKPKISKKFGDNLEVHKRTAHTGPKLYQNENQNIHNVFIN